MAEERGGDGVLTAFRPETGRRKRRRRSRGHFSDATLRKTEGRIRSRCRHSEGKARFSALLELFDKESIQTALAKERRRRPRMRTAKTGAPRGGDRRVGMGARPRSGNFRRRGVTFRCGGWRPGSRPASRAAPAPDCGLPPARGGLPARRGQGSWAKGSPARNAGSGGTCRSRCA